MTQIELYEKMLHIAENTSYYWLCNTYRMVVPEMKLFDEIGKPCFSSLREAIEKCPFYKGHRSIDCTWFTRDSSSREIRIDVLKEAIRIENRLTNGG